MSIQNAFIKNFTILLHKICLSFCTIACFFPNMIRYDFLIYFCDVVKIVITHKKIATFGYRQPV